MAGRSAVYADATTLISLSRIDRLNLLTVLPGSVVVTADVWREVTTVSSKPGTAALLRAREAGPLTVVDERKARRLAASDPFLQSQIPQVTGVIGLVLLARSSGMVSLVRPLLDDLIREDFRISPSLYEEVLRRVGEW